jgi:hypothetical protein
VCVLLFVAHASIQRACVARFALPRVTSFSEATSHLRPVWWTMIDEVGNGMAIGTRRLDEVGGVGICDLKGDFKTRLLL